MGKSSRGSRVHGCHKPKSRGMQGGMARFSNKRKLFFYKELHCEAGSRLKEPAFLAGLAPSEFSGRNTEIIHARQSGKQNLTKLPSANGLENNKLKHL